MDESVENAGCSATFEARADASGSQVVKLVGELDIGSVGPIRAAMDGVLDNPPKRLVIDLSDLRFVDSSGLSLFLALADQIPEVELRDPSPMIRKVIALTGLSDVFVMTP